MRYQKRISGPLLDRIDIHITVPRVEYDKLTADRLGEPSSAIRARVEKAREIQRQRFRRSHDGAEPSGHAGLGDPRAAGEHKGSALQVNADMGPAEVRVFCELDETGRQLMRAAMKQMNLSARAFHRVLKLARTIADLAGCERIETHHLAEAVQYRPRGQE
jgi:magnesium chelatase family protein